MPKTLAERIKEKRAVNKLNQFEAAYQINISVAKLQAIEQGYDPKRLTKKIAGRIEKWLEENGIK